MAEHYRFFGSAEGDPRQYNQTEFAEVFERFFRNGIFPNVGDELRVYETDPQRMAVRVNVGAAWINGYWYKNDSFKEIELPPADANYPRVHRIILRLDTVDQRRIIATVKVGTAQEQPNPPDLERNDQFWEISLATVYCAPGVTSIRQSDISDNRSDPALCGRAEPRDAVTTEAAQDMVDEHADRRDNPHTVTKAQVGLGNADNLSATSIRTSSTRELRAEVRSSFPAHADGKIIYHTGNQKFYGSGAGKWL